MSQALHDDDDDNEYDDSNDDNDDDMDYKYLPDCDDLNVAGIA